MAYAELHCLSNFSFQRGASQARELVERAHALGYAALAITDECSLAGIVRAWEVAKPMGLKLIIGSEFQLGAANQNDNKPKGKPKEALQRFDVAHRGHGPLLQNHGPVGAGRARDEPVQSFPRQKPPGPKLVLLAPTQRAYEQLCALITKARRRSGKGNYLLTLADFDDAGGSELLALWCPRWAAQGIHEEFLHDQARALRERFAKNNLWIAWERHLHPEDHQRLAALQALAASFNIPIAAAGDVHMHLRERKPLQDVLACIRAHTHIRDPAAPLFPNGERHLRPIATLRKLYPEAALRETLVIAERCTFRLDQLRYQYPQEVVPAGETATSHLRQLTELGLLRRYPQGCPPGVRETVEKELGLIAELGYESYFLTVEDIVRFARSRNILCQGRGSAANSAVCYALGITEVDSTLMGLLFERFISKERGEPPDIDVDFEHQRREEVIQYLYAKYGRERAALTATVQTYRRRGALRDVGKALGLSLQQVDALSSALAWWDDSSRLGQELARQGFALASPLVQQLLRLVNELRGFPRHLSQHVGGFVISDKPLSTLVPVENAAMPDRTIIQWDKDDLDAMGLMKVDVLALGMLTAIRGTLDLMGRYQGRAFEMQDIPKEDPATYAMICRGETTGVFQIESRAQMSMLPRLQPRNYWDLVVEVAIVRPGPIQGKMVHPYLRRRQQLEPVLYPSPELRKVLEPTLGIPLFQEQVMNIAVVAAGFTPGEADQVRRSMAAWKRKGGLEHFHDRLMLGMAERGYEPEFAEQIYQQILGFGSYGFPMSHAASFALLTYISCWMRCHEPAAFCAALLNAQPLGFYAPAQLVADARRSGVRFRPVDVLHSDWDCTLEPDEDRKPAVRLGLRQIAGLPAAEGQRIPPVRAGLCSVQELAERAQLSKRALNVLADAGAFASLAGHRHTARWSAAGVARQERLLEGSERHEAELALPVPLEGQDLVADYRSLGLSLGRHPLALLRRRLRALAAVTAAQLKTLNNGQIVTVAGIVTHRQRPGTASGVVFATLEDETGTTNLVIWPKVMEAQREAILGARLMVVRGKLQSEQGVISVVTYRAEDYSAWLGQLPTGSRDFH